MTQHLTKCIWASFLSVLEEANVVGILTEALTAHVQAVLADQT